MTAYDDAQIERFDTLEVEGFTLSDSDSSRGATPPPTSSVTPTSA